MTKLKAIEVRNGPNGVVVGWDTTCAKCGVKVHFRKGSNRFAKDTNPTKPDDTARCHPCYKAGQARWIKEDRIRRGVST